MTRHQFVVVMGKLFRVWEGTEGADDVLEDVCNTIAYEMLKLNVMGRTQFLIDCKKAGGRK